MKGQHKRVVMSVQMKAKYSIVEMTREATPVEIDHCKLVYCGCGRWKDEHILKTIMGKSSGKALNTMLKLLAARSEMVRFNAAKDILDRGGYAPVDKKEITSIEPPVFEDDIGGEPDG